MTAEPPEPEALATAVGSLLSDERSRDDAALGLEGAGSLTRRIGALMLRRAAERASTTAGLPDAARDVLINGNRALADAIEPEASNSPP